VEFRYGETVLQVNVARKSALLDRVAARLAAREGFALATINLDHLVKLARSPEFRKAYTSHDMIVADGHPIVWLSKLAGRPVARMPGSDLVLPLARLAAEAGVPVALIGSTEQALDEAATALSKATPGLTIAARIAPDFGFEPEGAQARGILQDIAASGAGLCFLALGAPKQEVFAAFARTSLPAVGFVSIGAGLDFLAGQQNRAPRWMQQMALEWVWRMFSDPKRLVPRYLRCGLVLPGHMLAAIRQRLRGVA
jgi:N-acetylglucosaminyldiphosphoundecaprenol N-acetyl-beta-D-mannosaminyltransferase